VNPDDGGSKHLWNIRKLPSDYTAQQPRRQPSSVSFLNYKEGKPNYLILSSPHQDFPIYMSVRWLSTFAGSNLREKHMVPVCHLMGC
jgi:hypothetical protein